MGNPVRFCGVTGIALLLLAGLAACGGGGGTPFGSNPDDPGGPPVGDLTVVAQVVSWTGTPAANVAVVIGGAGPVLTDALGYAEVTQVAAPYDTIVFDGIDAIAYVYEGLTRTDPVFEIGDHRIQRSISIDGAMVGGPGFPLPAPHGLQLTAYVEDSGLVDLLGPSPMSGGFTDPDVSWYGAHTARLTLIGLTYSLSPAGAPSVFTGYGRRTITVTDGDVLTNLDLVLGSVDTETVSGTVTIPPEYTPLEHRVAVHLEDGFTVPLPVAPPVDPTIAFRVPLIPGATYSLGAVGMSPGSVHVSGWRLGVRAPTTNLPIQIPNVAECGFPIQGAVGIGYETPFAAGPDEGDRVFTFQFQAVAGGPRIVLQTMRTTVTIPDLTTYGMGWLPGTPYRWKVDADGPFATLDEAVDPDVVLDRLEGAREQFNSTMTQWWEFTFGP